MARKLRVEYPGAIYHVMNRGDRREAIFQDDKDRRLLIATLDQACGKTGWQVHALCLMSNHFHLVVETPRANLVAGMKWFLGTYTSRFNRQHKLVGHVFSGRYKALIVDGSGNGYLRAACEYVHLNPVRAKLLAADQPLHEYRWSSYCEYLKRPAHRPAWLRVDRVLGEMGIPRDSSAGRKEFERAMEGRRSLGEPELLKRIRHGWCLGDEMFRKELLQQMSGRMGRHHAGEERQENAEEHANRLVAEELRRRKWDSNELKRLRKSDRAKLQIAGRLRRETTMTLEWIAQKLEMGTGAYLANCLRVNSA